LFNLKKVKRARRNLRFITNFLFKLFQINLKFKETRKDYGIEIFEYFYLPWRTNDEFKNIYNLISEFTLNPNSRLYTIYDYSKRYLLDDTAFVEVGTWKGGVCGLISLANEDKDIDIYACDTFSGVKNASNKDTFFKDGEYNDASSDDIFEISKIVDRKIYVVEGIFPESFYNINIKKNISMAHIDVDTYISAKNSFEFISEKLLPGGLVILDDYGGWFTDGVTKFGEELKNNNSYISVPNHLGQLLIFKK
tara:strand:- start:71 stop:823 length:753 start_codon:yes stop_codon:yes gene_type:complete